MNNIKLKRILISAVTIAAVGGLVFGATRAFFSDSETSTGNRLTAGEIDLTIDSTAHYDGMVCVEGYWEDEDNTQANNPRPDMISDPCVGSFTFTNLAQEKFFDLEDIKPGDWGENTLSLHVNSNDAYACILIHNMENNDNTCTEPEAEAEGNNTCGLPDPNAGELAQNIYFTAWADTNGDNIWNGSEQLLFTNDFGPASDVLNDRIYTLADANSGTPVLAGGETTHIGLQWCAGTMTVDEGTHTITCNGAGMGNEAQSDSVTADMTFYVEQVRNNPDFDCDSVQFPNPQQSRTITSSTGDGWASVGGSFTEAWQADARWGDGGTTATENEVRIGLPGGGLPQAQAHSNNTTGPWRTGITEPFTLEYLGGNEAKLTVGNVVIDTIITHPAGSVPAPGVKLGITVKTSVADSSVKVENVKLDGITPAGGDSITESTNGSKQYLVIDGDTELSDGFILTGDLTFTWGATTPSGGEAMSMLVQVQ